MGIGNPGCMDYIFFIGIFDSKCYIVKNGIIEQDSLLGYDSHLIPKAFKGIFTDILSINEHSPAPGIIKPAQEVGQG